MNKQDRMQVKELIDKLARAHFDCGIFSEEESQCNKFPTYQETYQQAVKAERDLVLFLQNFERTFGC